MAAQQKKKSSKDAGVSNSVRANGKAWKKGKSGAPVPPEVRLQEERDRLDRRADRQIDSRPVETRRQRAKRAHNRAWKNAGDKLSRPDRAMS